MHKKKQELKLVNQPVYSYWQALYMAFYSRRLYIDVVKRWRGFGLIYFLMLMVSISIPWSIWYTIEFNKYLNDELIFPIENMPLITIQNGIASIDQPMPYFVKNKTGGLAIEIDTITPLSEFPKEPSTLSILLTKDKFYFRPPVGRFLPAYPMSNSNDNISIHTFNKNDNEVFSGRDWVETSGIKKLKNFEMLFIFPIVLGAFLGLYFLYNIVLSSIGRIISIVILKYKITFKDSFRLAWVASTAPLAILTILQFLGFNLTGTGIYYIAFVAGYFALAIVSVKRESQEMVRG